MFRKELQDLDLERKIMSIYEAIFGEMIYDTAKASYKLYTNDNLLITPELSKIFPTLTPNEIQSTIKILVEQLKLPNIKFIVDRYSIDKIITKDVYVVRRKSDNKEIVLKIASGPDEVSILKELSSYPKCYTFIPCYYNHHIDENGIYYLEMEKVKGATNVDEYLRRISNNPPIFWKHLMLIIKDIACSLKYIHSKGIIHNDIDNGNIVIDETYTPKLIDYGRSCYEQTCVINPDTNLVPSKAVDMAMLGDVIYRIFSGGLHYGPNAHEFIPGVTHVSYNKFQTGYQKLDDIVNSILAPLDRRITSEKLCEMMSDI